MTQTPTTIAYRPFSPNTLVDATQPVYSVATPKRSDSATLTYTTIVRREDAFAVHFRRLAELAVSRQLWPEGAPAPSDSAVAWTEKILEHLEQISLCPERIVASGEGGVAVCFISGEKYADIECLNTGEILGVISNRHDRPIAWEVENTARGIARAAKRISEFFHK